MSSALYRLARRCAEHAGLVVTIWILVALAVMGANRTLGGAAADSYELPGTDSAVAQDLLNRAFPGSASEPVPVVLYADGADFSTGADARVAADVAKAMRGLDIVTSVNAPADDPGLVSDDGTTALVQVVVTDRAATEREAGTQVLEAARAAAGDGYTVELGGFLGRQVSRPDTRISEVLGLLAAILVLFLTLRRVSATVIPLVNALVSVALGLAVVGLLSGVVFIPDVAPTLGTMLGLGVGIDYALFLVVRNRVLLARGFDVPDAIGRTSATAGAAMVFAGGTLIAAVTGLVLTGLSFLAWLGLAAAIVVSIAVLASVTLVPALLGLAGRRVLPRSMVEDVDDQALDRSGWARLADAVTTRPWRFAIGSTLVLLLLAAPAVTLSLGHTDASDYPEGTTAREASDLMTAAFGVGESSPLAVVTRLYAVAEAPDEGTADDADSSSGDPRTRDPRLLALRDELAAADGIVSADDFVVSTDGGVAVARVVPEWASSDPQTEVLVRDLRSDVLPAATAGAAMSAHVGGLSAALTDLSQLIAERTPWFILGVVSLSFLLLMLAYRSLLIPAKAAAMNLISIAAAYGVVTAVFQWGWGASLIGLDGPVPIESYVPMMIFAVLFGLSMDYEVFLLTAFREHWERSGDMTVAVRRGLADTGRVVTAAALIMVVVFGSFVLSDNAVVKMFGIGLATAVAVDASIVRCLLVPSIMVLAAKGTWWLPRWLDRLLPQVHVEGDPAALALGSQWGERAPGPRPWRRRMRAALGAVVGVLVAALLVPRLGLAPPDAGVATVAAAVLGGVLVLLPGSGPRGRDPSLASRAAGFVLGVGLAGTLLLVLHAAVVPARAGSALVPATAMLVLGAALLLLVPRWLSLPAVLGVVAAGIAVLAVPEDQRSAGLMVTAVLLPALVAVLVAAAVAAVLPAPATPAPATPAPATPDPSASGGLWSASGDPDQPQPSTRGVGGVVADAVGEGETR
ncbi:MAG: MMPL family transporter [Candidatus Nanopelagicales bacterium]